MSKWNLMHEVMDRFYKIERVGMISFEAHKDKLCVIVVVYGNKNDEELKNELLKIEESIIRDFPELSLEFRYMSINEVMN